VAHRYIAFIPARGGSKGVPRKNLQVVGGASLVHRAIAAARSARITECFVSSEDDEILSAATSAGATAHRRSTDAATDTARASEVVEDFLAAHPEFDDAVRIVYLQPTSPFRTSEHVEQAILEVENSGAASLVSVVASHQLPEKTLLIDDDGRLAFSAGSADPGGNRQMLAKTVYPNGALYIFSVGAFREQGDVPVAGALPFPMGKVESLDIDDAEDLLLARAVADSAGI
jgi:CMP-N,N'-diacetyllegionaminic acid synthase